MTTSSRALAPVVSLALLLGQLGCQDDHDHKHGHAEHVDPPHRPSDFPDAVARLIAGHAATREALSAGRTDETLDTLLHVQRDLAKWLPEVAADSDMPERPWNRVNALAARLLAAYESAIADFDAGVPLDGDRLSEVEPLLADLDRLEAEADPAWFPGRASYREDEEPANGDESPHDGGGVGD
ncbi:hypothetical protein [Tautonia sociabilis]|uniref:Uncharacterized protein n=1 Tax=Tautonia sociabilis TaxID=2080755 RepID=A0A432MBX9_9BACT|nr:hypothetical protein [Tautonia sociabilis]RUL81318.1 hypothetical protein TsocGM_25255 [Tautonia sociabilis]